MLYSAYFRNLVIILLLISAETHAKYNTLRIPDTISGKTFNLVIRDTFVQFKPGNQTITAGINTDFWGPTLFFQKGDTVHLNVRNNHNDSTTLHWHGMHLPAVMDGGPHQVIPSGALWQPYWHVRNNAATYWYHPHLHEMTMGQMTMGIGGFIIVRDPAEAALALPRTYGVDDIPLALTTRTFGALNAFTGTKYGDEVLTNGTLNAEVSLPQQYIRLRILNAEMERGYNLGFSDNRMFYVITTDGGLLDAPVPVNRVKLMVGERVELLVNLGSDAVGSTFDLTAYNTGLEPGFPGAETKGAGGSLLNDSTFNVLHIKVASPTPGAITTLPASLVSNAYWSASDATVSRTIKVTDGTGTLPFLLDHTPFAFPYINQTVNLNAIEKWTVVNSNSIGHSFHIHDIQFKIVSRSSGPVATYESGWKDTYYLHTGESVSFVAKFDDYSDPIHPFMYHCHFAPHEDGGMMAQFVVTGVSGIKNANAVSNQFTLHPNPARDRLFISFADPSSRAYYITITDIVGRTMCMLPLPQLATGIDVSRFQPGQYYLHLTNDVTKTTATQAFIKE